MIWKLTLKRKRKEREIVDDWKLNDIVVPDSYLFLPQSEIISNVQRCTNLAVADAASFFYQRRLHLDHCSMFTVVTHRGQKTFQFSIIGYINSIPYFHQEMDTIFREVRALACVYFDDIACKATTVANLFQKLRVLFEIFVTYNISIKSIKTYLHYRDVGCLGQRVSF